MDEIKEILNKFNKEEVRIETLLHENDISKKIVQEKRTLDEKKRVSISYDEAVKRNRELLQELETMKGNLRSKAIYSPTEMQWEEICRKYRESPSLPVSTWRCHLPVFV